MGSRRRLASSKHFCLCFAFAQRYVLAQWTWRQRIPKPPDKMSFRELMSWLGNSQPGSLMRPQYEADFDRRKHVLQRRLFVLGILGLIVTVLYNIGVFEVVKRKLFG
jgi:hypothetical protein